MPSDEEFRELKDQVASLSSALATARRRIDDLEDGMADHLGLDWGESLVDANSPHPNMSVNTIESGGGIIRQDSHGMQIATNGADTASIWFKESLEPDPSLGSNTLVKYQANVSGTSSTSFQGAFSFLGSSDIEMRGWSDRSQIQFETGPIGSGNYNTAGLYRTGNNSSGDNYFHISGCPLWLLYSDLGTGTADPSTTLQDGMLWYRTDTDKFRGYANSTADNLAFESWVSALVTFNFIDAKGDIAVGSADNTIDNLAVGSDGQFLTADSSQTLGLKWGNLTISNDISPAQITSNQNDYNPAGLSTASVLRLNSDAARDITGLAGGADGRVLLIFNVGSFNIVLKDESASSTAANRFALNGDITLQPDNSVGLWYDSTSSRWRAF